MRVARAMFLAGAVVLVASAPVGALQPDGPAWMAMQVESAALLITGCVIAWRARG